MPCRNLAHPRGPFKMAASRKERRPPFDRLRRVGHTVPMRCPSLLRMQSLGLLGLLVATGTGLPSHHHLDPVGTPVLSDAGHHAHGVRLLDEPERITSQVVVAALPTRLYSAEWTLRESVSRVVAAETARPTSRAPPSARPRAPPLPI
jgi:hypothetical protein